MRQRTVDISKSPAKLVSTLAMLGDATSRNLAFSYLPDVPVSYGEETITESNLLELRRRHSDLVHLRTFSKHQESKTGADWEWYIVGLKRTFRMRVQAKRVQRNGVLKINHIVGQSGKQQRDILIETSHEKQMRPMYCIYCTTAQQRVWKFESLQRGCLLIDATNVPLNTWHLRSVEHNSWPWHLLFEPFRQTVIHVEYFQPEQGNVEIDHEMSSLRLPPWTGPTIRDLNEDTGRGYDRTGVKETTPLDLARVQFDGIEKEPGAPEYSQERQHTLAVQRMLIMDVRSLSW